MKTYRIVIAIVAVIALSMTIGFIIGRGNNTDQKQDQDQSALPQDEQAYFLVAKYKYDLSVASKAALDYKEESFQFLMAAGYDEERAQVSMIQKKWTPKQWKEYALIMERLSDALEERATVADNYHQVLKQNGLDERSFNIWYDSTVVGQPDPKSFITQKLGYK